MTTRPFSRLPDGFRLPDPPEREPDEAKVSFLRQLSRHFNRPRPVLVSEGRCITTRPERRLPSGATRRVPDMLIVLGADLEAFRASNAYIIEEQGKAPDFVLEVASADSAAEDIGPKRDDYESLGIREYWRFDETGEHYGARLAGDRLEDGSYVPVEIEELPGGALQGYSQAIHLRLRWEDGALGWHDPATGRHIPTFDSERERADGAEARAESAEARVRELERELSRRRGG